MSQYLTYSSLEEACNAMGVECVTVPRDDKVHYVPLANGTSKTAGRIRLFTNTDGGWVQNWTLGADKALFFSNYGKKLSPEERQKLNASIDAARKEAQRQTQQCFYKAKKKAEEIYKAAREATEENPYLKIKGVKPHGALRTLSLTELTNLMGRRLFGSKGKFSDGEVLIIPRGNNSEGLTTLEFIDCHGSKTYLRGGKRAGAYWITEKLTPPAQGATIGICEGVATALSVFQSTGIVTVSVGGCTSFEACSQAIKECYPLARIIILGDAGNGEKCAVECARRHSLLCCIPQFSEEHRKRFKELFGQDKEPSDFNDLEMLTKEAQP